MANISGKLTIKNATLTGANGKVLVTGENSVLNIEDVKMVQESRCFEVTDGATLNINEGCDIETTGSECTIFIYSNKYPKLADLEAHIPTLNVAGTVKCLAAGGNYAISGNNTDYGGAVININDGAFIYSENDSAIYEPQIGTVTVNGGTIQGQDGIYQKRGTLTINGGTIKGVADNDYKASGGGSNAVGHGIVVDFMYENTTENKAAGLKNLYYGDFPVLKVNGGEVISEHKDAIGYYDGGNNKLTDEVKSAHVTIIETATLKSNTAENAE